MLSQNVHSELQNVVLNSVNKFTQNTAKVLSQMFQCAPQKIEPSHVKLNPSLDGSLHFSILFTGVVYGEYILSMDRETARKIAQKIDPELENLDESEAEEQAVSIFAEALNIIVGESIEELGKKFEKLTMCPPRVSFGKIRYPQYLTGGSQISFPEGKVYLNFFFDQTQTDLTISYKNSVKSLLSANKDLELANLKLKNQQAKLVHSEKMASLGILAAGVAHEINNPLAFVDSNFSTLESYLNVMRKVMESVKGFVESFEKHEKEAAAKSALQLVSMKSEEDLSYILEDTQTLIEESRSGMVRIKDIVRSLKDFSHLDQQDLLEADLNEEMESVLKLIWNQIKFTCEVKKDFQSLPKIKCLPKQLNQVFVNLLVNSAQAMKEKGGTIQIKTESNENFVIVQIEDNGPGIPPEALNQIFDPFFTTKPIGEGTGLGLYISHEIVQKHRGTMEVKSEPGKGTRFEIKIPRDLDESILEEK